MRKWPHPFSRGDLLSLLKINKVSIVVRCVLKSCTSRPKSNLVSYSDVKNMLFTSKKVLYKSCFVLKCECIEEYYEVSLGKVNSWLNTVLKSKLEYMNLWFPIGFDFLIRVPLPSTIFKCGSIRILKLARVNVSDLSDVN